MPAYPRPVFASVRLLPSLRAAIVGLLLALFLGVSSVAHPAFAGETPSPEGLQPAGALQASESGVVLYDGEGDGGTEPGGGTGPGGTEPGGGTEPEPGTDPDPEPEPEGWTTIDGKLYYYVDGKPLTGWRTWPDGSFSKFSSTGAAQAGWIKVNGKWAYLDPSTGISATGKVTVKGYTYNLGPDYYMTTGWYKYADGTWCFFDGSTSPSGHMVTGWMKRGGVWYYLSPSDGVMAVGKTKVGGRYYHFKSSGAMATGWVKYADGTWSYYSPNVSPVGHAVTGWQKINGKWYFFDSAGVMQTGELIRGGKTYYLQSSGAMATGWVKRGGSWYLYGSDGAMDYGWQKVGGTWYYLDPETGVMQTGHIKVGGKWYYLQSSGAMYTGWYKGSDGSYYCYGPSGDMMTGKQTPYGIACTFSSEGVASSSSPAMVMTRKAQSFYSDTNWLIMVDTRNNRIGIFYGSKGNWTLRHFWQCSTGAPYSPTVLGEYRVTGKGYSFGHGYTCYYYTQFYGDYLMHSVTYYEGTFNVMEGAMGVNISAGCVRLTIDHAYWIYSTIPLGTKVYTYRG